MVLKTLYQDRPNVYRLFEAEARVAEARASPHVIEDPFGWLLQTASSMSCYVIKGGSEHSDRLNTLLDADHLNAWISTIQACTVVLLDAVKESSLKVDALQRIVTMTENSKAYTFLGDPTALELLDNRARLIDRIIEIGESVGLYNSP